MDIKVLTILITQSAILNEFFWAVRGADNLIQSTSLNENCQTKDSSVLQNLIVSSGISMNCQDSTCSSRSFNNVSERFSLVDIRYKCGDTNNNR